ncbi:MAG: endonuclease V [Methanobacteriaceae archaeon]
MCSPNLTQLIFNIQAELAKRVIEEDCLKKLERVAGADLSFSVNGKALAAAVVLDLEKLKILEEKFLEVELFFPYIPGFLGIRESDAVVSSVNLLNTDYDVLMVNGHGIMHPRGFGLASQVGLLLGVPTLGVAKRLIGGSYINQATKSEHLKNAVQFIKNNNRMVGAFFRGNYLSVGHKISLKTALDITKKTSIYKTPEPLRQAHILATKTFKRVLNGN